jgi:hypothetical protein
VAFDPNLDSRLDSLGDQIDDAAGKIGEVKDMVDGAGPSEATNWGDAGLGALVTSVLGGLFGLYRVSRGGTREAEILHARVDKRVRKPDA